MIPGRPRRRRGSRQASRQAYRRLRRRVGRHAGMIPGSQASRQASTPPSRDPCRERSRQAGIELARRQACKSQASRGKTCRLLGKRGSELSLTDVRNM